MSRLNLGRGFLVGLAHTSLHIGPLRAHSQNLQRALDASAARRTHGAHLNSARKSRVPG